MVASALRATDRFVDRHRFAFVGGLHRSGTTLIARSLADHPRVSGFRVTSAPEDEGQHLQDLYPTALAYGGPGRFGFAPEAHLTESSPLVGRANRDKLLAAWCRYWDATRFVLLEKSPPNLIRMRFLQALFPAAKFVIIVRHPVAVAAATQKWSHTTIVSLLMHWLHCHQLLLQDAALIDALCVVRYEDLVERPKAVLAHTLKFLGLTGALPASRVEAGLNEKYFHRWELGHLSVGDVRALLAMEPAANAFGYSLFSPQMHLPPSPAVAKWLGAIAQVT